MNVNVDPPIVETITVEREAQLCLNEAKGDIFKAADILEAKIRKNPILKELLLDPLIHNACYDAVRLVMRRNRSIIYNYVTPASEEEARKRVHVLVRSIYDWPLPGGKRLGDAYAGDLDIAGHFYLRQGKDMTNKGHWMHAIRDQLPKGKKVQKTIKAETLEAMRDKIAA